MIYYVEYITRDLEHKYVPILADNKEQAILEVEIQEDALIDRIEAYEVN